MMQLIKRSFFLIMIVIIVALSINFYVQKYSSPHITYEASHLKDAYTVIVLGARVYTNGSLSTYLEQRVEAAYFLYTEGKVERFLLSGDHGTTDYDEVNTMKNYLVEKGVPESAIFLDHAGFNTYNTMLRAQKVFEVKDCIVVSQDYHLSRAIYIARKIGLDAQGYASSSAHLNGISYSKKREILARVKSFTEVLLQLPPKFLGDVIPITGDSYLSYD